MLTYFPKYFSTRAIIAYFVTLALVSALYMNRVLPLQFVLFGVVAVVTFFVFSNKLTMAWERYSERMFPKKLFLAALLIRLVYVVFIYFYYISETVSPMPITRRTNTTTKVQHKCGIIMAMKSIGSI